MDDKEGNKVCTTFSPHSNSTTADFVFVATTSI